MSENGRFVDQQIWVAWYDGYDKAMIRWLLNNIKRDGKAVPTVFAAPERAFGQLAKVLNKRKHGVAGDVYTEKAVPLPFMSLSRLTDRNDFERRWSAGRIRTLRAVDKQGQRMGTGYSELPEDTDNFDAWEGQPFPTPVIIPYQLDGWARNLRDLDLIYNGIVQTMDQGDLTYLTVKHPEPWDRMYRPVRWLGMTNNSNLEVKEGGERTLRYTFTFEVEAWIMKQSTTVKAVKAAFVEVREWETEELIEIWEIFDVRVDAE